MKNISSTVPISLSPAKRQKLRDGKLKPFYLLFTIFLLFLLPTNCHGKDFKSKITKKSEKESIKTIRRIFKDYIHEKDGIDSYENKEAVEKSLTSLPDTIHKNELSLLINVWMYYDPTDFTTREFIMPIFIRNKRISLIAIKHKKKWESKDSAPYSELIELEKNLELSGLK